MTTFFPGSERMVDRTEEYRAALTAAAANVPADPSNTDAAKTAKATLSAQLFGSRDQPTLPFTVAALAQLRSVRTMHDFVLNNKS